MELWIVYIATCFDALRDAMIGRKPEVDWWEFHIVKWIAFFPALVYLTWSWFVESDYNFILLVVFTLVCRFSWRYIYNRFR